MADARRHVHQETFSASPARVFSLLLTPSAIRDWWGASRAIVVPQAGGLWAAAWGDEDSPDFVTVATIRVFEPCARIVLAEYRYFAKSLPPPFAADFTTEFVVAPHDGGATLRVTQDGFPCDSSADDYFASCETGWRNTFAGIRRHLAV